MEVANFIVLVIHAVIALAILGCLVYVIVDRFKQIDKEKDEKIEKRDN